MRTHAALALGGIAAMAIVGTGIAAGPKSHVMNVPLPDGSVARVEYVGDVAPKITVEPRLLAGFERSRAPAALPSFAGFDQMMARMNQQMQELARQPMAAPGMNVAAYGNMPAGTNSTSIVSYSNGGSICTRTTEVVSQGPGKAPKVTSNVSGDCSGPAPAGPATPVPPAPAPITRT